MLYFIYWHILKEKQQHMHTKSCFTHAILSLKATPLKKDVSHGKQQLIKHAKTEFDRRRSWRSSSHGRHECKPHTFVQLEHAWLGWRSLQVLRRPQIDPPANCVVRRELWHCSGRRVHRNTYLRSIPFSRLPLHHTFLYFALLFHSDFLLSFCFRFLVSRRPASRTRRSNVL